MANNIFQRQNQEEMLKCLVVQRQLYSLVKYLQAILAFATVLSVAVPLFFEKCPEGCGVGEWISAVLAGFVWVSTIFIGEFRDSIKYTAAGFQQYVDSRLFAGAFGKCCDWCGVPLPSEIACRISKITQRDIDREEVSDWYSDYSIYNEPYAVLCCQKENVRWDRALRVVLLCVLAVCLIGWVSWAAVRLQDVTLRCALPTLSWCCGGMVVVGKVCVALLKDIMRINKMRKEFDQAERAILNGRGSAEELASIQRLIYEHRKKAFLVPDSLYKLLRIKFQDSEDRIAKNHREMVA